jgi:hypothetical protein
MFAVDKMHFEISDEDDFAAHDVVFVSARHIIGNISLDGLFLQFYDQFLFDGRIGAISSIYFGTIFPKCIICGCGQQPASGPEKRCHRFRDYWCIC